MVSLVSRDGLLQGHLDFQGSTDSKPSHIVVDGRLYELVAAPKRHPFCVKVETAMKGAFSHNAESDFHPDQLIFAYLRDLETLELRRIGFKADVLQQLKVDGVEYPHNGVITAPNTLSGLMCAPNIEPNPEYWTVFRPFCPDLGKTGDDRLGFSSDIIDLQCAGHPNYRFGYQRNVHDLSVVGADGLVTKREVWGNTRGTGFTIESWSNGVGIVAPRKEGSRLVCPEGRVVLAFPSQAKFPKLANSRYRPFFTARPVAEHYGVVSGDVVSTCGGIQFHPDFIPGTQVVAGFGLRQIVSFDEGMPSSEDATSAFYSNL